MTIVSADIVFPPVKIQGASPMISRSIQHLSPFQASLQHSYTKKGKSSHNLIREWMRENPQEAKDLFDDGYESIRRVLLADIEPAKRDKYLGAPYWVYDNNDMAYRENLPNQPVEDKIESFDGSV
jgi:hypothetical protein